MSYKEMYGRYLEDPTTKYFVFDSKYIGDKNYLETDFKTYMWSTRHYNRVSPNDLFIYRRPKRGTNNKGFYFFGTGRIHYIEDLEMGIKTVRAHIVDTIMFRKSMYQGEDPIENFVWRFKERKHNWHAFFNQYGMC